MDKIPVIYDAVFSKKGEMVYISHLDLMKLFRRAIRRAALPFVLTGGFTPRVKISIPEALKLGKESDKENMRFWLQTEQSPESVKEKINAKLPEGVEIYDIRRHGE